MTKSNAAPPDTVRIEKRDLIYDGFLRLENLTVSHGTRNGGRITVRRLVHDHGNAVAILPVDRERRTVLLARQLRMPVYLTGGPQDDGYLVEACAGLRDGEGEEPGETAAREAEEELGYRVHDLELVGETYMSPGILTERTCFFLATYSGKADRIADGGGLDHEGEDIDILEWSCAALWQAVETGAVRDAKLMILAQALRLRNPELFE